MSYTDISKKPSTQKSSPSNFMVVESYKMIRTNLLFLLSQADKKSFTVSSANEAEGKSTTSINIAIAFSQLGCRRALQQRQPPDHRYRYAPFFSTQKTPYF